MKFSEIYNVKLGKKDDWFNPILSIDTQLFIDPFLLYAGEYGHFVDCHKEVISFFNSVFKLVARSQGNKSSILWKKATGLLYFPEVAELCLGYTDAGTKGSGSGGHFVKVITEALWEAIKAGLKEITHFEEIGIIREGIGADRISDITAGIIRKYLALYTKDVCERHGIQTSVARYPRGYYDVSAERWLPLEIDLPKNSYNGRPILLIPRKYLRSLPTINAEDFWEYCYCNENETLRAEYGQDITKRVDKKTIIDFARRHPEERSHYIAETQHHKPIPYDFNRDSKGLIQWYDASAHYCSQNPLSLKVSSVPDFENAIKSMVEEYKQYVENNEGWRLLWNDNRTPRKESAAQLLFLGIVKHYCKPNDIDISREADIGRGPVDFKVSHGYQLRVLFELKLAKNSKFWNGLEKQLPKYQEAEDVKVGYFVVVVYSDKDIEKLSGIQKRVKKINENTGYEIKIIIVDARSNPPSASKL
jgi:hypothetical protein